MELKNLLSVCTLDNYTESKLAEQIFDITFENESQVSGKENGQQRCKNLTFPFARSPLTNVALKNTNVLLESKNDSLYTKDIIEIILDGKDFKEFEWQPGDTIGILPRNSNECVDKLLKLLELECKADTVCTVKLLAQCTKKNAKIPTYIPTRTTPREILRDSLNLKGVLSKKFLRSLAEYCTNDQEKNFLKTLSSKEGSSIYNDFILSGSFTLVDILQMCDTCKPPISLIVEHLPRLLPRPYSIANSPLTSAEELKIIFSIVRMNPGITTKMLKEKSLELPSSLLVYLREPNYFRYIEDNYQQNQILIAIGTGLAPFLGFLQHKEHLMHKNKVVPGITWLFVGATTPESVIHREELLQWKSKNVLNNFVESYSRTRTTQFHSIQEALEHNAQKLIELLMQAETYLYICADGGLISKSIEQCLQIMLAKELTISMSSSIELLKNFKAQKKYREDTWQ